jgi:hypothetical protein
MLLHSMLYTVLALELPSSSRGVVSLEHPREIYSKLSWPEWSAGTPQDWTLFLPLNSRYIPIHDQGAIEDTGANETNEARNGNT